MSDLLTRPGPPPQVPASHRWYLRPWFIIVMALVLAGAVTATVLLILPAKTITIHGTVIDQVRPGLGVATATIKADGRTGRPSATGAFTMTSVPENAVIRVTAPYYRTHTVTASTRHLAIRLTPLPIALTVTSTLTGAPLKAAISAPAGRPLPYTIASSGTVRLYRAGPGETLTVAASGYRPAHATVRPDQTLTVALEPMPRTLSAQLGIWASHRKYPKIVGWALRPGVYTFQPPTPQDQAKLNRMARQVELYDTSWTVNGTTAAVTITIDKPGVLWGIKKTVQGNVGHASPVTIAGQKAWHGGPDSSGTSATMAKIGRLDLMVFGDSTAQTDQIMTQIVNTLLGATSTRG